MPPQARTPPHARRASISRPGTVDREFGEQLELFGEIVVKADPSGALDSDGDGQIDALADLQAVMWDCDDLMMVLFDYYASLNSDGRISSLTFNEWGIFVDHFGLGDPHSPYCKKADLDRIFIAVDTKASHVAMAAAEAAAKKGLKLDSDADEKKALRRTEFFTALVHIAIAKYVRSGEVDSVAKGLHTLMVDVIDPRNRLARTWTTGAASTLVSAFLTNAFHIASAALACSSITEVNYSLLPDPNLFRRSCYVGEVSAELSAHAVSLRELHAALSEYEFGAYAKRIGSKGWLEALRALDFIGGKGGSDGDISERDANLCFVWSRMATSKSGPKDDALPFEGLCVREPRLRSLELPQPASLERPHQL